MAKFGMQCKKFKPALNIPIYIKFGNQIIHYKFTIHADLIFR